MKIFRITIATLALLAITIVNASDGPYRLAGSIVTSDPDKRLALIETEDGAQLLLRKGDSIDGGTVVEITQDTVRLRFESDEIVLKLVGTGKPVSNLPTAYRREDFAGGAPQPVDTGSLNAISQLASSADTTDSKKLAERVLTHLGLPAQAHIMAVNDQSVESSAEAVRQMAANIDAKADGEPGLQFVISISDATGNKRVYIMSDADGQITDRTIPVN